MRPILKIKVILEEMKIDLVRKLNITLMLIKSLDDDTESKGRGLLSPDFQKEPTISNVKMSYFVSFIIILSRERLEKN